MATSHRYDNHSKCLLAGAIGRINKVEEEDVAFISTMRSLVYLISGHHTEKTLYFYASLL